MTRSRAPQAGRTICGSILAFSIAGVILAGCGSSSSGGRAARTTTSSDTSSQQQSGTAGKSELTGFEVSHTAAARSDKVDRRLGEHRLRAVPVASSQSVQRAQARAGKRVTPRITGPNPCRLVSSVEARRILGGTVAETEAPLGPTCIIKVSGQKRIITLSVETLSVPRELRQMKKLTRSTVAGHQAYCGGLGQPQLLLSLGGKKTLSVNAPCPAARALAAIAASHLKS